jgi:hypothetical protein
LAEVFSSRWSLCLAIGFSSILKRPCQPSRA